MSNFTYEYEPYSAQNGEKIPNFVIYDEDDKVAETNEDLTSEKQESVAILFTHAQEMLELLREVYTLYTTSERFDTEWASRTSSLLNRFKEDKVEVKKGPSNTDLHLLCDLISTLNNDPDKYERAMNLLKPIP